MENNQKDRDGNNKNANLDDRNQETPSKRTADNRPDNRPGDRKDDKKGDTKNVGNKNQSTRNK